MYSNAGARKSMDSLSPASPHGHRHDFPFHSSRQGSVVAYPNSRRGSVASSIHSIGGALDSASGSWGGAVLESGQNAISTLLQPPIVRTGLQPHTSAPASSSHKPPTARDIPPVTLTNIERIDPSEFRPYLTQVGALYEQLRRAKENDEAASDSTYRRASKHDELADGHNESLLRPGKPPPMARKSSTASLASLSSIEAPGPVRRTSSNYSRRGIQGPPPLSTIPTVYFDEDFHLENPRTFDIVSERSEVIQKAPAASDDRGNANGAAPAPRKALATNAILQEKLSWYMDTVEMHLISSISTASTSFFTALGSLKGLHTEAAESVERIKTLRKELGALDEEVATRGLAIVQKRRRRENLQQLHNAVRQLRDVVAGVASCEALVDDGEVEQALDDIEALEKLIAGQVEPFNGFNRPIRPAYPLKDLRGASALQGVNDDITTLRLRIGKVYETRLVDLLLGDLRRHLGAVSNQEVLMRWSSASMRARGGGGAHSREPSAFPSYLQKQEELRDQLLTILSGLQRAGHLSAATTSFRETALREIKTLVRKPLPSSTDDDNESMMSSSTMGAGRQLSQTQRSSILARNLRALEPEDGEELLIKVYIGVTETLRRLTTQAKLLLDVASSIGMGDAGPDGLKSPPLRSPPFSPPHRRASVAGLEAQEEIHKALELSNLLGQAVDVAQDKIVRLLRVRAEQNTRLPLVWFLRYFTLNLHFANECESISGRSGTTLKTVVNGHIRDFVQSHGDAENQRLATGMESDQWVARDFGERETELLARVLGCDTQDAEVWLEGSKIWIPFDEGDGAAANPSAPNGSEGSTTTAAAAASGTPSAKAKTRAAVIGPESFLLPQSAVLCLEGISRFLHLAVGIPSITADVATSLVAYLQFFNSRCTQLILGAGATKCNPDVKRITAKNLALASQALGFVAALVPHLRRFVQRRAPSLSSGGGGSSGQDSYTGGGGSAPSTPASNIMAEFDKVVRLYREHQNNIHDKLVEIMAGRAAAHSKTMQKLDWDADAAAAAASAASDDKAPAVHSYMDELVHETLRLLRALATTLAEDTVRSIVERVFDSYRQQFGRVLSAAEVQTQAGRESMMRDIKYFRARLSKIEGSGDVADYLTDIVRAREIAAAVPVPDATPADAGGSGTNNSTADANRNSNGDRSPSSAAAPAESPKPPNGGEDGG